MTGGPPAPRIKESPVVPELQRLVFVDFFGTIG